MNLFPLAASNMDMIIGVIAVIVWIVSQVLSRKKDGTGSPSIPGEPAPPTDPQDELRKFFEQIEKATHPPAATQPIAPPPPPPVPSRVHSQPNRHPAAHRTHLKEPPAPPLSTPAPIMEQAPERILEPSFFPRLASSVKIVLPSDYSPVIRDLHDPVALRRMIVTMEVLGKPAALRPAV